MSKYVCNRCNYESFSKRNVERHIGRINQCEGDKELKVNVIKDVITCAKCGKKYDSYDSLKRHQKISCKKNSKEKNQEKNQDIKPKLTRYGIEIIKAFENNNGVIHITIRGTHEELLFKASDIRQILNIEKIDNFDSTEKIDQELLFLTEKGLYKLLFESSEPMTKQFTDWVYEVIKEIRLNKLEEQLRLKDIQKEKILLTNFNKKPIVYIGYTEKNIIKIGYTNNIESRLLAHKRDISSGFTFEYIYESVYNREIERKIYQHPEFNKRRLSKFYKTKDQTELFELDRNFTIERVDKLVLDIKKEIEDGEIGKLKSELIEKDNLIEKLNERLNLI